MKNKTEEIGEKLIKIGKTLVGLGCMGLITIFILIMIFLVIGLWC